MGQGHTPADVLSVRLFSALSILLLSGLLSGCSYWNGFWHKDAPVAAQPLQAEWQFFNVSAKDVAQLLQKKGLVTPVYQIMPDNELLPDYGRTAKLYDELRHAGLSLVSAENTLKWHYKMIAAVEETCPDGAIDPLPSCSYRSWYNWMPGFGELYERVGLKHLLKKTRADYLIVSDPGIFATEAVRNLRYAPSSSPIVQMPHTQRAQMLGSLSREVSLDIILVERDGRHVEAWDKVVARCTLPMKDQKLAGRALRKERERMLDVLRNRCLGAIPLQR